MAEAGVRVRRFNLYEIGVGRRCGTGWEGWVWGYNGCAGWRVRY